MYSNRFNAEQANKIYEESKIKSQEKENVKRTNLVENTYWYMNEDFGNGKLISEFAVTKSDSEILIDILKKDNYLVTVEEVYPVEFKDGFAVVDHDALMVRFYVRFK